MPRTRNWLPWLWLGVVYLLLVTISWKRWANPIVDCGREMYVPWQIAEGKMLYRDLFWMYGPLVPYWHALLFKICGAHLNVLYAIGLLLTAAQASLVFVIARRVLSGSLALLATFLFLAQFAFRPTLGNLVFPYSFNADYACALNLLALWLVLRHGEGGSRFALIFAGICVGLSLLSKQEIGLAGLAFLAFYSFSLRRHFKSILDPRSSILYPLLLSIAIPVLGYGLFASQIGWGRLLREHLWPRQILGQMKFFEQYVVGTLFDPHAIRYLLGFMLLTAGGLLAVVGIAYVVDRRFRRLGGGWLILAAGLCLVALPWSDRFVRYLELNQIYSIIFPVLLIALVWSFRNRPSTTSVQVFWISLYALLATWRAPLFAGVSAYSSFFMAAGAIVFVWVWAEWIPQVWKTIEAARWRQFVAAALAVMFFLQLGRDLVLFRTQFTFPIGTHRGELVVHRDIGPALSELIAYLDAHTQRDKPLLLFPEETSLYFLCDRVSPSRYYQFAPALMPTENEERALIEDAEKARVRVVAVSNRATTEYGKPYFGIDYYPLIREWLLANFHVVKTIGNPTRPIPPPPPSRYWPSDGYGIEIYERK